MYQPAFHPQVDKDLSRIDISVRRQIRDKHISRILQNPREAGKNLSGALAGLKSYHFTANRVEYRMVYDIIEETVVVLFLMVGPRENFYTRLLRRLTG